MANVVDQKLRKGYDAGLALKICEMIADGQTLVEIAKQEEMPSRATIHRWLAVYPKFFDAYERAREVSAQSFEEEALLMARTLKGQNDFTGTKVQAYNIAMQQLRWSASRRDKARYGQQIQQASLVPIQINTTLNLGQEGMGPATDTAKSVYTLDIPAVAVPAFSEGYEEDSVERLEADGVVEAIDLDAEGDENEAAAWGVPSAEKQQLHNPGRVTRTPRPKKGHKSSAQIARTARLYSEKERRDREKMEASKKED